MNIWKRNVDGEELKQYLLGILPQKRQERLEKRVLTEDAFDDQLQAAEDELVDQYLAGKLTDRERQQFESHFSVSEQHQRKISFSRVFRNYINALPSNETTADRTGNQLFFGQRLTRNPIFAICLTLSLTVGTFGVLWLVFQRQGETHQSQRTLGVILAPGSLRSETVPTQRIKQPLEYGTVELSLEMGTNEYRTYQVEIFKELGPVKSVKPLEPQPQSGHFKLIVKIDARLLEVGDYSIKVSGIADTGQAEFKDQYQLRVTP